MRAIHPYFGGKARAASEVWERLGKIKRYIEPFFGSGAMMLANPHTPKSELINDIDRMIPNLWRAIQYGGESLRPLLSAPPSEVELKARNNWLLSEGAARLESLDWDDLQQHDPEVAAIWLWRQCAAIGGQRSLHRGDHGKGVFASSYSIDLDSYRDRFARVQVMCGDWSRCVSPAALRLECGSVGVFLDPPYGSGDAPYEDGSGSASRDVWNWAVQAGNDPRLRICVAGYDDRDLPVGWSVVERAEHGGFGTRTGNNNNKQRERLWFSPHCLDSSQVG